MKERKLGKVWKSIKSINAKITKKNVGSNVEHLANFKSRYTEK